MDEQIWHCAPRISRRAMLGVAAGLGITGAGGIGLAAGLASHPSMTGKVLTSQLDLPPAFTSPLTIPPVARPVASSAQADIHRMTQRAATAEILPGLRTELWTYDGTFPGPTIESTRGRSVHITQINELPVPTVVHLHGGRTPAASDGYPTDLILPGNWNADQDGAHGSGDAGHHAMGGPDPRARTTRGHREYLFPNDQRAAMLWYHDHRMDFTAPAIWRGLAGMHIIRDDTERALDLPHGDHELPLMITDRSFTADGQLAYPALDPELRHPPGVTEAFTAGVMGDVILVNGVPWPTHEVDTGRYRLRLLNASNARYYHLNAVTDAGRSLPLTQIGSDQGLLPRPVRHDAVPMGPAERYDLIIDFTDVPVGTRVQLQNTLGTGRTSQVMEFHVVRAAPRTPPPIPKSLDDDLPQLDRREATTVRELAFGGGRMGTGHGWLIDGKPFDPARADVTTSLGAVEVWRLIADVHHPIHLHLVGFQVLSRAGRPPELHDGGLKDTVALRPGEAVEIITRFDGYRGRFLFHCHNAEHEDMGMMANLEIV